jgi:hypothetical protein
MPSGADADVIGHAMLFGADADVVLQVGLWGWLEDY